MGGMAEGATAEVELAPVEVPLGDEDRVLRKCSEKVDHIFDKTGGESVCVGFGIAAEVGGRGAEVTLAMIESIV